MTGTAGSSQGRLRHLNGKTDKKRLVISAAAAVALLPLLGPQACSYRPTTYKGPRALTQQPSTSADSTIQQPRHLPETHRLGCVVCA